MARGFLVIGVGGSGGKTLRYTWRELTRALDARGWDGPFPDAWQFLHVDVPQNPDIAEGDVPADVGGAVDYVGLARSPIMYPSYDRDLCGRDLQRLNAIAGWRPDPAVPLPPPWRGAGQRRVVGRTVTVTQLDKVEEAVDRALAEVRNPLAGQQLAELSVAGGSETPQDEADSVVVIVVSSLAGGSGSGAFLDIVELLMGLVNGQEDLSSNLITMLFSPDVFGHLPAKARQGVEPNALAATAEFISAFEHQGPVSAPFTELGGAVRPIEGRRTGPTNFIIGTSNSSITYEHSHDVFRAVGKTIATYLSEPTVQSEFLAYVNTNPAAETVTESFRITDLQSLARPCSSLGYANVTLGRKLFAQYAAQRLAKAAMNTLLHAHRGEGSTLADDILIRQSADAEEGAFFEKSGLWEFSTTHNQVLDALRPAEREESLVKGLLSEVQSTLKKEGGERSPQAWFDRFNAVFEDFAGSAEVEIKTERNNLAKEWVVTIQERVKETVAQSAGTKGLPVTIELLRRLTQQVLGAADELERERKSFDQEERSLLDMCRSAFNSIRDKVITLAHRDFRPAVKMRRQAFEQRLNAELNEFTALLLRDIAKHFLPALVETLVVTRETLQQSERVGDKAMMAQWSDTEVPRYLRAAPNEVLLEAQDVYPAKLGELFEGTTGVKGVDGAQAAAVSEVVSGAWISAETNETEVEQSLVIETDYWVPEHAEARPTDKPAGAAKFRAPLDARHVLDLSKGWVEKRSGAISSYVGESMADWLKDTHLDSATRANRFGSSFELALDISAPLVSINSNVHKTVHGTPPAPPAMIMSPIPLGTRHPARAFIEAALARRGMEAGDIERRFDPSARNAEVHMTTFLSSMVHPVVFSSLMVSIQQDWQKRQSSADRRQFWSYRRARQLPEFIPVSSRRLIALVKGWLVGSLLGQISALNGPWSKAPPSVWTPHGRRTFPRSLLGPDVDSDAEAMGAALESMPLALLTFASGASEELEAYMRLLDLGAVTGNQESETGLSDEFEAWIKAGQSAAPIDGSEPCPVPFAAVAGEAASSPEERASLILAALSNYESAFSGMSQMRFTDRSSLAYMPMWELRAEVLKACEELTVAINHAVAGGTGTPVAPPVFGRVPSGGLPPNSAN